MTTENDIHDLDSTPAEMAQDRQRKAWQAPVCIALVIEDAENGVNSFTDSAAAFS